MLIFPAIDLYEGEAVRLYQGDYNQKTVYSRDPVSVAKAFRAAGATWIHLVDLEGAKFGTTPNFDLIARIKRETGLSCEVGGGIREEAVIRAYTQAGIDRVILGTAAVANPAFVAEMAAKYGSKIAVGIDVRDGQVAVKGWTESSGVDAFDFCRQMQEMGVSTVICTDISRDGAMRGTNRALYRELSERFTMQFIASGGVSDMNDIRALADMGLYGAIVGKAYYTGAVDLADAIREATK